MRVMVIDASMVAAWTLDDEVSEAGKQLLVEAKNFLRITSSLFWHEYRNILLVNQRRGRIRPVEVSRLLQHVHLLGIETWDGPGDAPIMALALEHGLTAYDASYLALAVAHHAVLATNDAQLARAAIDKGLALRTLLDRSRL